MSERERILEATNSAQRGHSSVSMPPAPSNRRRRRQKSIDTSVSSFFRAANADEIDSIESSNGWPGARVGLPGQDSGQLKAYRMRGMWPRYGYSQQMLRADPAVYSGYERQLLTVASLNWDIVPPPEASEDELDQTEIVKSMWRHLPYGFLAHAVMRPFSSRIDGFSITEKTANVDDKTGWWMLTGMHWVAPWTVRGWIIDEQTGYALGALLRDDTGTHPLFWESIYYQGQMFWGRNYEGVGVLRPIKYYWDHKTQIIVDDAHARDRASSGIPYAEAPDPSLYDVDDQDYVRMEQILQNLLYSDADDPAYYIAPAGWQVGVNYLDGMPDATPMLRYLDHQIAQAMTDTLSQLGVSEHGARAVGAEQRIEKWSMIGGLCAMTAHNIDHTIHRHIYDLNGWDTSRMCRTVASGANSMDVYRRLLEFLTTQVPENPVVKMTPEMKANIERTFS